MKNRPVHFEIQADDPERAKKFYEDVFGWEITKWLNANASPDHTSGVGDSDQMEYWLIMTAPKDSTEPGINGGLLRRPTKAPAPQQGTNAYVVTMQVDDYDATEKKILAAGGIVALPKMALMGMAWQGYYLDPEGNTFGVHQADPNAK